MFPTRFFSNKMSSSLISNIVEDAFNTNGLAKINEELYAAPQYTDEVFASVIQAGIKSVINVRAADEDGYLNEEVR